MCGNFLKTTVENQYLTGKKIKKNLGGLSENAFCIQTEDGPDGVAKNAQMRSLCCFDS